ncbi:MAG TPA: universal stress protein [Jatrophihabitantaceae bacterium]|jgi:DNA-binding transcriptional LysR family regulator|nr:universal stress protein [Jatrophihabitantaceae bacterium]
MMLSRTAETGIAAEFRSVRGDALAELTRIAEQAHADAVVVGASEHLGHRIVGSLAARLVRTGKWPVIVVRSGYFGLRRWRPTSPTRSTGTRRSAKRYCPSQHSKRSRYRPLTRAGLGITLLPGNVVPPVFDGVLRRPNPPVQRMLSAYTRVRPDPITAAFVQAICHHTMATPRHILSRLEPGR